MQSDRPWATGPRVETFRSTAEDVRQRLAEPSHRPRACSAIHTLTSPPLRQGLWSRGRHLRETSAVENRLDVRESRGTARNGCRRRSKAAGTGPARLPDRQPPECGSARCGGRPRSFWYVEGHSGTSSLAETWRAWHALASTRATDRLQAPESPGLQHDASDRRTRALAASPRHARFRS